MGLFKKIKKALKFEVFNVKGIIKKIAKNPQRLLVGAVDPLGTKIANTMFGTKWKPAVNQLGGATADTFNEAKAKGMDVGLAKSLHQVASVVAGFYGGAALGQLASTGVSQVMNAGVAGNVAGNTAAATEAGASVGAAPAGAATTQGALAGAAPMSAATQAASGVIQPVAVDAATMGSELAGSAIPTTAAGGSGLLSQAAKVGKGIYGAAKSDAGQMIISNAMQGYAQGKAKEAEYKQQDKYKRAFTPEELAQMNGGSAPTVGSSGGYLDRARRVSEFLGDRGAVPMDQQTVAGYARGEG